MGRSFRGVSVRGMLRVVAIVAASVGVTGCMSFRPIEPVISPPAQYRGDAVVPVEFVHPAAIGMRCAERGAKFLMLPGINSNACANVDLISMPNPCATVTGGWYAAALCHEIGRVNGWSREGGDTAAVETFETVSADTPASLAPAMFIQASVTDTSPTSVTRPPAQYRGAATAPVEFIRPSRLAQRCAERGAKILALPGIHAAACADADLITLPNPCASSGWGWYAAALCHEMAHANGWSENHEGGRLLGGHVDESDAVAPGPSIPALDVADAAGTVLALAAAPEVTPETLLATLEVPEALMAGVSLYDDAAQAVAHATMVTAAAAPLRKPTKVARLVHIAAKPQQRPARADDLMGFLPVGVSISRAKAKDTFPVAHDGATLAIAAGPAR